MIKKLMADLNLTKIHLIFICLAVAFIATGITFMLAFDYREEGQLGLFVAGLAVFMKGGGIIIGVLIGANKWESN